MSGRNGISFRASVGTSTKASEVNASNLTGFNVTAIGNGANYFTDMSVAVSGGTCTVAKTYYWPSYELGFYAYANVSGGTVSIENSAKTITGVTPAAAAAEQTDMIVAYETGDKEHNESSGVPLNFRHALSQVVVKAANLSTSGIQIKVAGVKLGNILDRGTFTYPATSTSTRNSGTLSQSLWNTSAAEYTDYVISKEATDSVLNATAKSIMFGGAAWMVVPQALTARTSFADASDHGSSIGVMVQILDANNGQLYPATAGQYAYTNIPIDTNWEPGKKYTYTLNFLDEVNGGGAGVDDNDDPVLGLPIRFTLTVDDWDPQNVQMLPNGTIEIPDDERNLAFEVISDGTIVWKCTDASVSRTIYYKKNGGDWTEITSTTEGASIDVVEGDVVEFYGTNDGYADLSDNDFFNSFADGTAEVYIYGNILSLIDYRLTIPTEYCLSFLFSDDLFGDSSIFFSHPTKQLRLPATTLASSCYSNMFNGCTSLTAAPELPAMTLANLSYGSMFVSCTSLTTAPELPATRLAEFCYENMFSNCSGLIEAPELPATTLALSCYQMMFYNCTSLTTAPELPATTLASSCYESMFYGCSSLIAVPELPATTLASNCYRSMFGGCSSLTTAPELPATTLVGGCYANMFYGCTGLTAAPELPATTLALGCYGSMFNGCTILSVAPELPATTLANKCYYRMFFGCTNLTTAPELPATTLTQECYHEMFCNCTSLTTAPELPATTLATGCYMRMFSNCINLAYVKCLATDVSASDSLSGWLYSVKSTGTFVKHPDMASWPSGNSGIPSGWTVEDAVL